MFSSEYSILECPPVMPPLVIERPTNWKFNKTEIAPNCPRCASSNTKFCYYNNYSFSQPRYICKGCRRYWTKGGSLRSVPVGGGCRKSRRSRAARDGAGANYPAPAGSPTDVVSTNTSSENVTEIDLAAVFAKYVNPNVDHEESSTPGASSESSDNVPASSSDIDSQMGDVGMMFENGVGDQMILQFSMDGQDFVYQNSDALEMQGIIGEDPATTGILWPNETNFGSQMHLQEFGLFAPEDQLRTPGNLTADNWGSFDLSAYEFF